MSMHSAATFRTLGNAATTQNFLTIRNSGVARNVDVRRVVFQMDATAVLTTFMPIMRICRISVAPTGGTALTKVDWGPTASDASITVLGGTATDSGAATGITSTPGATMWQQYGMRMHTLVGQVLGADNNVLSIISADYPVRLGNGEGLLVHIVAAAGTSNPATNHYFVQIAWEETVP